MDANTRGYPYCFRVRAWGRYAMFTRPELKVERVSYDAMTPSAAAGLLGNIYLHPGMVWKVDKIKVLNPIRTMNLARNEVTVKGNLTTAINNAAKGLPVYLDATGSHQNPRYTFALTDVDYVIDAHFELVPEKMNPGDSPEKFSSIIDRRLTKGQYYFTPYFGCREFTAHVAKLGLNEDVEGYFDDVPERDLGYMMHDVVFENGEPHPRFFRAVMRNGVIDCADCEVIS